LRVTYSLCHTYQFELLYMIFWIRFFFEVRLETVLKEVPTDAFLKVPANEPTLKYIFFREAPISFISRGDR
jgi:hypothetical protein